MTTRMGFRAFLLGGLAVTVAVAVLLSPDASGHPDGLERVAIDEGFAEQAEDHTLADLPTADYGVRPVDDERLSTGLAGLLGVAVTFAVTVGAFHVVRRARGEPEVPVGSP